MALEMRKEISEFGGFRSMVGIEVIFSIILGGIVGILTFCYDIRIDPQAYSIMATASAPLLGMTLAGYALLMNIGSEKFKRTFVKNPYFHLLRLDFSIAAIILGSSCLMNLSCFILAPLVGNSPLTMAICLTFFTCGVLYVVVLLSNSLRMIGRIIADFTSDDSSEQS